MEDTQREPKPKVQGNWTCSHCGGSITELPFSPDGERPISCDSCWKDRRSQVRGPRPKVQGNWTCSDCGAAITQLPFDPQGDQVACLDCWRKKNPRH